MKTQRAFRNSIFILVLTVSFTSMAGSFSKPPKEPTPSPSPSPAPAPAPTPTPAPAPAPQPQDPPQSQTPAEPVQGDEDFVSIASAVGKVVDDQYPSYRELLVTRGPASNHPTDSCQAELKTHSRFADQIAFFIDEQTQDIRPKIQSIASYFGTSSDTANHEPVSLIRHPMCAVTRSSLAATISDAKVPSDAVIAKLNSFANQYNEARRLYLNGDPRGLVKVEKLWNKLYGCLAYNESLTTADTKKSGAVSDKYSPSDYRRPAGVLFYEDPAQDQASRLNIGLFQFTPTASGNIQSCIRTWNSIYPSCAVNEKGSQAEMIRVLGSGYQTFNAFCGVNKVLQTFAIQVNTSKSASTHPSNQTSKGLKAPQDRCVSLHFAAGKAYNHFGPFQNSGGNTLNGLFSCVMKD